MTYGPNASPLWQAREYRVRAVPASGGDNGADERSRWVAQPQPQPPFIFPSLPSNYEDSNNPSTRTSLRDSWQRDDDKSGKFSSPSTANNPRSLNDATEPLGTRVPPLSVDKRVLESTHMQQLVRFLLLAANRHDYPDQFAAEFRALAVHRLLRMVPRLDFLNEVQGLDTLDYYRMLKNEHMRVPLTLAKRAEVAVDAELRLLRWREVDGDPQGNAILAYKEQLLAEIRDDQAQYPSYCDKLVQDAAQQLCGKEHSVQHFEFILTMLNDLQQCDTVSSLAWVCIVAVCLASNICFVSPSIYYRTMR